MHTIRNRRIVVMGLGRFGGGVGAARFCAEQGAKRVLVTDMLDEPALAASMAKLADLPIDYRLGEHREADFTEADLVIVNPAVDRRHNRYLRAAERAGTPLTTEIELLVERLPDRGRTIGVTGTAGKSTVTAMIGHVLSVADAAQRVHVGGNLGGSLLTRLDQIEPGDPVVLELSSFMLETMHGWSPHVAVVTNLAANHLDRHDDLDAYVRAKQRILAHQRPDDRAVLGPGLADWRDATPGEAVIVDEPVRIDLAVPGAHNAMNAALAVAACEQAGVERSQAIEAVAAFAGLPHRLQQVAEQAGRSFYNDSKSTTAEAAMLAIDSFPPHTAHAILGGYDKRTELSSLAHHAARRCAAVYTIGQTGPTLADAAERVEDRCPVHRCGELDAAVREAVRHAEPGQVVLLSPGCASTDQFENYEQRGRRFAELVLRYTTETGAAAPERGRRN